MKQIYKLYIFYFSIAIVILYCCCSMYRKWEISGFTSSDVCVVTAYYPVKTNKHSTNDYKQWYTNFFNSVSAPVICFCPPELEQEFRSLAKGNVTLVVRDFYSFQMMSEEQMKKWNNWYLVDPEKEKHSPELYAIWATKQEFVLEAM